RPNQHLAVLLPKHLWKPDSSSSMCDNFYCRVQFSFFDRKHHCRKCGGVFCSACTSRTTPLLDTSNLSFLQPPRNIPLSAFESPTSPIVDSRVCEDCWDQIHGCPTTPHTPEVIRPSFKRVLSHPISMFKLPLSPNPHVSASSSISSSPISEHLVAPAPTQRSKRVSLRTSHLPLPQDLERSYGELDAYPLRRSSLLCKATGGGRWEPKQIPVMDGYRQPIPGGKAPYEIEMEREEMLERQRRENPVVKDGDFQYRFPKDPEPIMMARSPYNVSTF
ncbi:FYVE zinc finger-domain-containing protein, partial [Crassisporium funariophilum]